MILETREYFLGLHDCILSGFGAYVPKIGSVGVGERGLLVGWRIFAGLIRMCLPWGERCFVPENVAFLIFQIHKILIRKISPSEKDIVVIL